jgi:manganese/zinc/iron transport system permease protein
MFELLTDYTFLVVLGGASLVGLVSGALGSYAVLRKQSLMGDVVSHAALLGVVMAFFFSPCFSGHTIKI